MGSRGGIQKERCMLADGTHGREMCMCGEGEEGAGLLSICERWAPSLKVFGQKGVRYAVWLACAHLAVAGDLTGMCIRTLQRLRPSTVKPFGCAFHWACGHTQVICTKQNLCFCGLMWRPSTHLPIGMLFQECIFGYHQWHWLTYLRCQQGMWPVVWKPPQVWEQSTTEEIFLRCSIFIFWWKICICAPFSCNIKCVINTTESGDKCNQHSQAAVCNSLHISRWKQTPLVLCQIMSEHDRWSVQ